MPGPSAASGPARDLRWVLIAIVVAVVVVFVVDRVSNVGPQRDVRGSTLSLTLRDYAMDPRNVRMQAGTIQIQARNVGRNVHGVRVVSDDDKRGSRRATFGGPSKPIRPGDTALLSVGCLGPGRYRIIGSIQGDEDLGMVGDLEVTGRPSCRALVGDR